MFVTQNNVPYPVVVPNFLTRMIVTLTMALSLIWIMNKKPSNVSLDKSFKYFCNIFFDKYYCGSKYFGGELLESYLYGRFEARLKSAQGDIPVSSFYVSG